MNRQKIENKWRREELGIKTYKQANKDFEKYVDSLAKDESEPESVAGESVGSDESEGESVGSDESGGESVGEWDKQMLAQQTREKDGEEASIVSGPGYKCMKETIKVVLILMMS